MLPTPADPFTPAQRAARIALDAWHAAHPYPSYGARRSAEYVYEQTFRSTVHRRLAEQRNDMRLHRQLWREAMNLARAAGTGLIDTGWGEKDAAWLRAEAAGYRADHSKAARTLPRYRELVAEQEAFERGWSAQMKAQQALSDALDGALFGPRAMAAE